MSPLLVAALAALAVLVAPRRSEPPPRGRRLGRGAPSTDTARRQAATSYDVADALVLLSLALRSGMGQQEALERVAGSDPGPVAAHLRTVAAALR